MKGYRDDAEVKDVVKNECFQQTTNKAIQHIAGQKCRELERKEDCYYKKQQQQLYMDIYAGFNQDQTLIGGLVTFHPNVNGDSSLESDENDPLLQQSTFNNSNDESDSGSPFQGSSSSLSSLVGNNVAGSKLNKSNISTDLSKKNTQIAFVYDVAKKEITKQFRLANLQENEAQAIKLVFGTNLILLIGKDKKENSKITSYVSPSTSTAEEMISAASYNTSSLSLVDPKFSSNKIKLWNARKNTEICEFDFGFNSLNPSNKILSVMVNKRRMIVVLPRHVHIVDLKSAETINSFEIENESNASEFTMNSGQRCALSPDDSSILAISSSSNNGSLILFDTIQLSVLALFQPHTSRISCLAFSHDGSLLATASVKGTVIRVFLIKSGSTSSSAAASAFTPKRICTFRRGMVRRKILHMSFSPSKKKLCATSSNGTIHIFDIPSMSPSSMAGIDFTVENGRANGISASASDITIDSSVDGDDYGSDFESCPLSFFPEGTCNFIRHSAYVHLKNEKNETPLEVSIVEETNDKEMRANVLFPNGILREYSFTMASNSVLENVVGQLIYRKNRKEGELISTVDLGSLIKKTRQSSFSLVL